MNYGIVIERDDGSFVIRDGLYHVPTGSEEWDDVNRYAQNNPDKVKKEEPFVPSSQFVEMEKMANERAERVPDLEDAVMELAEVVTTETEDNSNAIVDLASYVAEMEARIAALEAAKERV